MEKLLKVILYMVFFLSVMTLMMKMESEAYAERVFPEKWYRDRWCSREMGQVEVILADEASCDCLTPTHSVEIDFADKWAEAIGQSLFYSLQTDKKAGIVLIMESLKDEKYWFRLKKIIERFDLQIDIWAMGAGYARLVDLRERLEVLKSELAIKSDEYKSLKDEGYSDVNLYERLKVIKELKLKISEEEARIKAKIELEAGSE